MIRSFLSSNCPVDATRFLHGKLKLASRSPQPGFTNFEWALDTGDSEGVTKTPGRFNETLFRIRAGSLAGEICYIDSEKIASGNKPFHIFEADMISIHIIRAGPIQRLNGGVRLCPNVSRFCFD